MSGTDDPLVKVAVYMPASLFMRIADLARRSQSSVSKLCREGAARALADETSTSTRPLE